jgi:hypothetical protein
MNAQKIRVSDIVKMNKAFLQTLSGNDRRNEARRRYVVEKIQKWNDGTVMVDLAHGRNNSKKTRTTASWLAVGVAR